MFDAIMGFLQSFLLLTIFLDGYFQADVSTIIKRLDNLEKKYHELRLSLTLNTVDYSQIIFVVHVTVGMMIG